MLRLLGEVMVGSTRGEDLGTPKQRCVLAALAVESGLVVTVERLAHRVWGEHEPSRARETLHSYVSRLRRTAGITIENRSGGYVLTAEQVDLHVFRGLCADAHACENDAVRLLTEALALWRGEALTGVSGEWADAERDRLAREHLAAQLDLVDARLRGGQGGDLVAELSARADEHPLDERVEGQLLLALHQSGRTADALEHYRAFRTRLVDELGTEPGAALRDVHQRLLTWEAPDAATVPRQLPAAPRRFVGREDELARLDALEPIAAIAGTGGIGKTWLALHWAHRHAACFPDGQLFVDLRGFAPEGRPMEAAVAVRGFLDALGADRIPADPHAQAALFRSLVADRRMLLVLDNAVDTAQVTPLLPGGGSCAVIVTSRNRLPSLITGHGAHHVPLDVLPDAEARALLTDRLGASRVAAEPAAVDRLIALCGGFPLVLGVIAAHAHARPHTALALLADELDDLGALDDDPAVSLPTVLSWSVRALTPLQANTFAQLAIAPGPDIGLAAATSLTGLPRAETRAALRGLEQASLLRQGSNGRYRMHDLIRRHAGTLAQGSPRPGIPSHPNVLTWSDKIIDAADLTPALRRVVDFYLHTAHAADRVLNPHREPIDLPHTEAHTESLSGPPADDPAAMAWFDAEHRVLIAAQQRAAEHGWHLTAWQLAWVLETYHRRRGLMRDRLEVWRTGLAAVAHLPDPAAQILTHRLLGRAHAELGHHDEAADHLHQALALAEQHGDRTNQAHLHRTLAAARASRGEPRKAHGHALEALELCRSLENPVWEARALNAVGWYAALLGEHTEARERCMAALTLFRAHHDPEGVATTLDSLGYIAHCTGDHAQAVEHYEAALRLCRELGTTTEEASTLERLALSYEALGDTERAHAAREDAEKVRRLSQS